MRTMNVNCPVCQQTHPNTHMTLLDWQTASYKCPITQQVVNLTNYQPSATTMILSPGTTEDTTNDANGTIIIADTVPFGEEKSVSMAFFNYPPQNVRNDQREYMQIGGGGVMSTAIVPGPNNAVLAKWPAGGPLSTKDIGDFVLTFGFKMTDLSVPLYQSTNQANMPIGFDAKIQFATDTYLDLQVSAQQAILSYYVPGATPGTPGLAQQQILSGAFVGELLYNCKIDVTGTVVTVSILEAQAKKAPSVIAMTIPGLAKTAQKVSFSYPILNWPSGNTITGNPSYQTQYPADSFQPYGDVLYYPFLIAKGTAATNVVIPATPM